MSDQFDIDAVLDSIEMPAAFLAKGKQPAVQNMILAHGPLTADHVRIASEHVANGTPVGVSNQVPIKQLRAVHHRCAQLLAAGTLDQNQVAILCNFSPSRVSWLINHDPAFQELVAYYRSVMEQQFLDFVDIASDLSKDALVELQTRLDEKPETFTNNQLFELVKTVADRSGNAPVTRSVSVSANVNLADRLRSARARVGNGE